MHRSVAVIGDDQQHDSEIQKASHLFEEAGLFVLVPVQTPEFDRAIMETFPGFRLGDSQPGDAMRETVIMHRVIRAEAVYVVCPNGLVNAKTSLRIGRLQQASRPLYFSDTPDLPITVPKDSVCDPNEFVRVVLEGEARPLYENERSTHAQLERDLTIPIYRPVNSVDHR